MSRLYTLDTKALNHILMNSYDYQKPEAARYNLSRIVGSGKHSYIHNATARHLTENPRFRSSCRRRG
jgi:hypothetical protein